MPSSSVAESTPRRRRRLPAADVTRARTIFFGSGAFAIPVLEAVAAAAELAIEAVLTAPSRPAGRDGAVTTASSASSAAAATASRTGMANAPDPKKIVRARVTSAAGSRLRLLGVDSATLELGIDLVVVLLVAAAADRDQLVRRGEVVDEELP